MKNNSSKTTDLSIRTLCIRIKDEHSKALKSMAYDVNSAKNILACGRARLVAGIKAI